ncbi:AAA family ATPase [bacterium]|nr:AAA family ATPase [bacterium]
MKINTICLKNFLIIRKVSIPLSSGFTAITGETGSGKSLFVSAMKALRGEKITKSLLGKWGKSGEISAEITIEEGDSTLRQALSDNDIFFENNTLILRRVFGEKNTTYLNDSPVSLALTSALLGDLIEIGSQFENRELFKKDYRMRIIDSKAGNTKLALEYKVIYHQIQALNREIEALGKQDDPAQRDYLEYQIGEIEKLETWDGEDEELSKKIKIVENREKIMKLGSELASCLENAAEELRRSDFLASEVTGLIDAEELSKRINASSIEIDDIHRSTLHLLSAYDSEIDDVNEIRARYDRLSSLLFKHKVQSSTDLLKKADQLRDELSEIEKIPNKIKELQEELKKERKKAEKLAEELHKNRSAVVGPLEKQLLSYLVKFGMKTTRFSISLNKLDDLNETGFDDALFEINTIGTGKMAELTSLSGGELSRFLLAVKLLDDESGRVILFDEIDSSIGGEIAKNTALEMRGNSSKNQILMVTHFPQSAAVAQTHIVVEKNTDNGEAETDIRTLSRSERVRELARMMGDSTSEDFIATAEKMVDPTL